MNRLDVRAFALAVALVGAIAFVLCTLLVTAAPEVYIALATPIFHVNANALPAAISTSGFFVGFVVWTLTVTLLAAGVGFVYNRFSRGGVAQPTALR